MALSQLDARPPVAAYTQAHHTVRRAALDTARLLAPYVACNPAIGKACYQHHNTRPGVYGDWDGATGYTMHPVKGTNAGFLDVDKPALIAELLATFPQLADGFMTRRGDHASFGLVTAYPIANFEYAEGNHEVFSWRTPGQYQIGPGSLHPSGDTYIGNGKPITRFDGDETLRFEQWMHDHKPLPPKAIRTEAARPADDDRAARVDHNLTYLDPDCGYADWIRIGMGIQAELGDAGLGVWDSWSAGGTKYKPGECERKWRSFKRGGVTGATLTAMARAANPASAIEWAKRWGTRRETGAPAKAEKRQQQTEWAILVGHPEPTSESESVSLGALVRLLNSGEPKAAYQLVECSPVNRRTTERRQMGISSTSIEGKECGTKIAQTVSPRQNWIRITYPQNDPITALLPFDHLTSEHFDNLLTEDEIEELLTRPEVLALSKKQQEAIQKRMRIIAHAEKKLRELDTLTFVQERPVDSLSDLRRQVLRQIIEHYTKVDPETGEIIPAKLSNAVQACLIGVTIGALGYIREQGGIEQVAPAEMEKPITHAQRLPTNTRRVAIKGDHGTYTDWRSPSDPSLPDYIDHARRLGREVVAVIQPIAEQRLGPLPERQPRQKPERRSLISEVSEKPAEPKPARVARRTPRQTYAAELMANILYHLKVDASKAEPLDVLAGKLRSVITDRGRMLYHQCIALPLDDRMPFVSALSAEDKALFWDARNRAGKAAA